MIARRTVVAVLALTCAMGAWSQAAAIWLDVPFVAQPREGCGAATIAMVMKYWAAQQKTAPQPASEVANIQNAIYDPHTHGIPASSMASYFNAHGFRAFAVNGSWNDLEEHLRKG